MDLNEAQDLILRAVENPKADVPPDQLALATAIVLVRNELLGAKPRTVTVTYIGQETS